MSDIAILSGSKGNLGPIWADTLRELKIPFCSIDWPERDITIEADRVQLLKDCKELYGMPSILINNAGIDNPPGSPASFFGNAERIVGVNLVGAMRMADTFIPPMIALRRGLVVNVGSIQGFIGADWRNYPEGWEKPCGYNVSKAGLIQLSRSIAVQYGRYGIRAVTIAFGPFDNGKFDPEFKDKFLRNVPLERIVSRESLAATLRYVIQCPELTGQTILVDAGYTAW
jgi:NAD(P)-dependent dehydrogenase (short-subunit alcohol dehydrogenase family)